jgi:hypothetical protein
VDARADAYGRLILDAIEGKEPIEVVEREDGLMLAYPGRYWWIRSGAGKPSSGVRCGSYADGCSTSAAARRLSLVTNAGGRLIGQSFDPHGFKDRV